MTRIRSPAPASKRAIDDLVIHDRFELDVVTQDAFDQAHVGGQRVRDVEHDRLRGCGRRERREVTVTRCARSGGAADLDDIEPRRIVLPHLRQHQIGVADDRGELIVEVVRHAAGDAGPAPSTSVRPALPASSPSPLTLGPPGQPRGDDALQQRLVATRRTFLGRFREVLTVGELRIWVRFEHVDLAVAIEPQVDPRVAAEIERAIDALADPLDLFRQSVRQISPPARW